MLFPSHLLTLNNIPHSHNPYRLFAAHQCYVIYHTAYLALLYSAALNFAIVESPRFLPFVIDDSTYGTENTGVIAILVAYLANGAQVSLPPSFAS